DSLALRVTKNPAELRLDDQESLVGGVRRSWCRRGGVANRLNQSLTGAETTGAAILKPLWRGTLENVFDRRQRVPFAGFRRPSHQRAEQVERVPRGTNP